MSATHLHPETRADTACADALIARAFGPGRYAKTAERLREGRAQWLDLCVVARIDGRLVGCVRQWPVRVGEAEALLLGPIAVEAEYRSHGLGAALVRRACEVADAAGFCHIVLVGDLAFFGPLGFAVARGWSCRGRWTGAGCWRGRRGARRWRGVCGLDRVFMSQWVSPPPTAVIPHAAERSAAEMRDPVRPLRIARTGSRLVGRSALSVRDDGDWGGSIPPGRQSRVETFDREETP